MEFGRRWCARRQACRSQSLPMPGTITSSAASIRSCWIWNGRRPKLSRLSPKANYEPTPSSLGAMKFPRNARIFRGQLDAAPFAAVFFLLVIFLMLGSLIYTPGVRLQLPIADELPGTDKLKVSVAIDSGGRYYYDNQLVQDKQLGTLLHKAVLG